MAILTTGLRRKYNGSSSEASQLSEPTGQYLEAETWCVNVGGYGTTDYWHLGVCNVHYLANKQANPNYPASAAVRKFSPHLYESYRIEVVREILRSYVINAEKGNCPEYDVVANRETVIAFMKRAYPQWSEKLIRVVLYWMAKCYEAGTLSPLIIRPRTLQTKDVNTQSPEAQKHSEEVNRRQDNSRQNAGGTSLDISSIVKWGGIGLVVVAGAYALGKVTNLFAEFKGGR
ncbi:MAG TPA: hypothetical protein DIS79_05840 [Bacteroidetes bacterium]|nr:hypothetical protein [Bacteroidota bacterium]HRK04099.1 hypothetical protein [Chlorobiota bacterium]